MMAKNSSWMTTIASGTYSTSSTDAEAPDNWLTTARSAIHLEEEGKEVEVTARRGGRMATSHSRRRGRRKSWRRSTARVHPSDLNLLL
jgi:hypothetical protein